MNDFVMGASNPHRAITPEPPHLIRMKDGEIFLAARASLEGTHIQAWGFWLNKPKGSPDKFIQAVASEYKKILQDADPTVHVHMYFGWSEVLSVQDLVYRHKGVKK